MDRPLWQPSPARIAATNMKAFMAEAERRSNIKLPDYQALWRWSVDGARGVLARSGTFRRRRRDARPARAGRRRQDAGRAVLPRGAAQFRREPAAPARRRRRPSIFRGEDKVRRTHQLAPSSTTRSRASPQALRAAGVRPGDRVAGYHAQHAGDRSIAMLATAAIGAVWSSCSPDFGVQGVLDRFGQIEPQACSSPPTAITTTARASTRSTSCARSCAEPADGRSAIVVLPYRRRAPGPARRIAQGGACWAISSRRSTAGEIAFARLPLQPPALHPVFVGHDRRAEMHRPRRGRHAAAALEGASAPLRREAAATGCSTSPPAAG